MDLHRPILYPLTGLLLACSGLNPTPTPTEQPRPLSPCGQPVPDLALEVEETRGGRLWLVQDFPSEGLQNTRDLRIYLPPSYTLETERLYPVLYMHDGQNLFDATTAAFGVEWEVDERVDTLSAAGWMEEVLVVGIDNTAARISEYTPTADATHGGGDGEAYTRFLVEEVKPWVDQHLRTRCEAEHTAVMGSSLGGLISFYMGQTRPEVFGHAGAVSPSFWWDDQETLKTLPTTRAAGAARFWIDAGTAEGEDPDADGVTDVVADARAARDGLLAAGWTWTEDLGFLEQPGAAHDERAWASRVEHPLRFMFGGETGALTGLTLTPYNDTLGLSGLDHTQSVVSATWARGLRMSVPGGQTTLSSSEPGVATITAGGEVRAVGLGQTTLGVAYGGLTGQAPLSVVEEVSTDVALTFRVAVPEGTPPGETVYIVGDREEVGGWDPSAVGMTDEGGGVWSITLRFERGSYLSYKYTRGSWGSVEKGAGCEEIANRVAQADTARIQADTIVAWADLPPCGGG